MDGYELSEDAARRTAAVVRRVEAMIPGESPTARRSQKVYRPAWYRLAVSGVGGEYTVRRQAWDAVENDFADVTDADNAEYNLDITAHDFRGRAGAAAGAAGTGLIVHGWKVWVNGEWITLVDVGGDSVGVGENDYEVYQTRTEGGIKVAAWDYARLHA